MRQLCAPPSVYSVSAYSRCLQAERDRCGLSNTVAGARAPTACRRTAGACGRKETAVVCQVRVRLQEPLGAGSNGRPARLGILARPTQHGPCRKAPSKAHSQRTWWHRRGRAAAAPQSRRRLAGTSAQRQEEQEECLSACGAQGRQDHDALASGQALAEALAVSSTAQRASEPRLGSSCHARPAYPAWQRTTKQQNVGAPAAAGTGLPPPPTPASPGSPAHVRVAIAG